MEPLSYQPFYLLFVTILTILESKKYVEYSDNRIESAFTSKNNNVIGYLIVAILVVYIGFRPYSYVFMDMVSYQVGYRHFALGKDFVFDWSTENVIFDNFFFWLGSISADVRVFFVAMAIFYFGLSYYAMTKLFRNDALYAYIVWLGAFSTFSYATNGIKAGVAASLFLCALSFRDKRILAIIFLVLCIGVHHSMVVPVAAYVMCYFIKNPKYYLIFWFFALVVSICHVTFFQEYLAGVSDERGASYLSNLSGNWGGKAGFRWDFVFYSALPVVVGYYIIFVKKISDYKYNFFYNVYLLTNGIWMLCMYAAYTNRIAYLSWGFLPVVTMYPLFNIEFADHQYKYANYIVWYQLIFTIAMHVIYYA